MAHFQKWSRAMKYIGFFSEMKLYENNGSVKEHMVEKVNYDKQRVIEYLLKQKRIAGCPREGIDCVTGETISPSFFVYNDGEYEWCDFLVYHIKNYSILLSEEFIQQKVET